MLKTIVVGMLEVNCYLLWDDKGREAFVIDPGGDGEEVIEAVKKEGLGVKYIINTHGHFDHVGADGDLKAAFGAPVAIHAGDAPLMLDAHDHAVFFGARVPKQPEPDKLIEDGAVLQAGRLKLRVMHTPGHTRGGICLYEESEGLLFTGDTLFAGSVGRTDSEGGSHEDLIRSIKTRILTLKDPVRVLPGHGPETTVGEERAENPFLTGLR